MVKGVVSVIIVVVVLGALISALWDTMLGSDTAIQALTDTGTATTMLQDMWPIALIVVGVGIAAGIVFYALRKFKVI